MNESYREHRLVKERYEPHHWHIYEEQPEGLLYTGKSAPTVREARKVVDDTWRSR